MPKYPFHAGISSGLGFYVTLKCCHNHCAAALLSLEDTDFCSHLPPLDLTFFLPCFYDDP